MKLRMVCVVAGCLVLLHSAESPAQITRLPNVYRPPGALSPDHDAPLDSRPRDRLAGYPSELSQPLTLEGQPSAGPDLPGGTLNPPGYYPPGYYPPGFNGQAFPPQGYDPTQPMLYPDGTLPPCVPQPCVPCVPAQPALPKGAKPGVFQQVLVAETYMPRFGGDSGFGINDVLVQATFGFPFFTRDNPLVITPAFEVQMLDGPTAPALPPELYDASISFLNIRKFSETFSMHFGATPGVHSDFEKSSSEAIRVPARILGLWQWNPETQWIFGVLYLARDDVNFLPAGGLIWTPNEETRLELIFPRPRYAQRFGYSGDVEWWWYLAGEFGGGTYAVQDAGGFGPNVVTLSDLRAMLGVERRVNGGINSRIELGYVFNRQIEFQESLPTFEADATLMVRGGLSY